MERHLVVMAKAPVAGVVKSRLGAQIGVVEATRFYRVALARLLRRLAGDPRWRLRLAVTPDSAVRAPIWPRDIPRQAQGRGDLGARMQSVFDWLPPGPAVIIGSDIPGIAASHIARGFAALRRHDAVFGPAEDGGYWLIGLKRRPVVPQPFAGVRWSTCHALTDTLVNCRALDVAFLDTLPDVDAAVDWRRWRRQLL